MTDSKVSFPSSRSSAHPVTRRDLKALQSQHETIQSRLLDLKDSLSEKDLLIKTQRNTIKLYEQKISTLQQHNTELRQLVSRLSTYVTEELKEGLPALPSMPEEEEGSFRYDPVGMLGVKRKGRKRKAQSSARTYQSEVSAPMASFSTALRSNRGYIRPAKSNPIAFDPGLAQNLFEDFTGADFIKALLDAQLTREDFQKTVKFLLGNVSKEVLLYQTKTILFETLSFFLTSRNVAYQNASEVFLPRVMEMLIDVLEVERVVLYVYDAQSESFLSRAITADIPEQLIIPRDTGHLSLVYENRAAITIQNAYKDASFDPAYDQLCSTITQNLCCVPIQLSSEFLGVLECSNKKRPFGPTDLVVLSQIAKHLAVGLTGAGIGERLRSYQDRGNRGSIDSAKEALIGPLMQAVVSGVQAQLACERVTVFLFDATKNDLYSLYGVGLAGQIRTPLTRGIASLCFTSKSIQNVAKADDHPMFNPDLDQQTSFRTREILALPLGSRGVLECINKKTLTAFSKSDEGRAVAMSQVLNVLLDAGDNLEGVLLNADFNELCMQAVAVAVVQVNTQGLLQKVNRCAADMFSLTPERMVGMTVAELLSESADLLADFQTAVSRGTSGHFKDRKLCLTSEHKAKSELKVTYSIMKLEGLAGGSCFVLLLQPQGN